MLLDMIQHDLHGYGVGQVVTASLAPTTPVENAGGASIHIEDTRPRVAAFREDSLVAGLDLPYETEDHLVVRAASPDATNAPTDALRQSGRASALAYAEYVIAGVAIEHLAG